VSGLLQGFGHEVIVANPRQVELITESSRKDDRLGAPEAPGGKWIVSNTGGSYPMLSRSELFFVTADGHIIAAAYPVKADSFVPGKPPLVSEKTIRPHFLKKERGPRARWQG
jgi:hypothetical protein